MTDMTINTQAPAPAPAESPAPAIRRRGRYWKPAVALLSVTGLAMLGMVRGHASEQKPNILFVVMDDVGIDQMESFGYGGRRPARMPTIDQIANNGIRFTNTWSMPACTTSRAVFFSGRFPLRTNVQGALGPDDLANSHVSPFEATAPKLLKKSGYQTALFGKFHLALQGKSPFGYDMVRSLGWDYFEGWLDKTGDPSSIDTTAGGVARPGTFGCGFVPGKDTHRDGADEGACYLADNTCQDMIASGPVPPGRACRDRGGIFDPEQACKSDRPPYVDFNKLSGHYVSPLVISHTDGSVEEVPASDARARRYRGSGVVDAAITWIKQQPEDKPWMATVSFASAHTPVMQPPAALTRRGALTSGLDCLDTVQQRVLTSQMIEAMDTEVGRLLVATNLARRGANGTLEYLPGAANTMIVVVGDNGSFGTSVKHPFDITRAKGTAYQSGVWVPLIVAGPLVTQPDRDVTHMVNIADIYQLFGEIAGIDVAKAVRRPIDSVAMMPYLVNPSQGALRKTNFTQVGTNLQAGGTINGPCSIGTTCSQIPVSKEVCEDNGGIWWGADSDVEGVPDKGFTRCCDVNVFLTQQAGEGQTPEYFSIQPLSSVAMRNERYKVVRNHLFDYNATSNACEEKTNNEFYEIDEAVPTPKLDTENAELLSKGALTPRQRANYKALSRELDTMLGAEPECLGDGNDDGVVNQADVANWEFFAAAERGKSSWYDFNLDGRTDTFDLQVVMDNLGKKCRSTTKR